MKKFNLFVCLAIFTMILAACGGNDETNSDSSEMVDSDETAELEFEPEDIDPDSDVCEICAMAIADDQHEIGRAHV